MGIEEVDVGRIQAQFRIETVFVGFLALDRAIGGDLQPLRFMLGGVVVPLDGGIDGHADVACVGGLDLVGEQVARQVRMASFGVGLRVVVDHAVVAVGEAGDGVDVRVCEHLGPCGGVEFGADPADLFAGVEVEVDLAETEEILHWVGRSSGLGGERKRGRGPAPGHMFRVFGFSAGPSNLRCRPRA